MKRRRKYLQPYKSKRKIFCLVLVSTLVLLLACFLFLLFERLHYYERLSESLFQWFALLLLMSMIFGGLIIAEFAYTHWLLFRLWQGNGFKIAIKYRIVLFALPVFTVGETILFTECFPYLAVLLCSFLPAAAISLALIVWVFVKCIQGDMLYKVA